MFRGLRSRIAVVSAPALIAVGALAAASPAQAVSVGPNQYCTGQVFGDTSQSVINVVCPGVATTGHPAPGQTVEVLLLLPPVTATAGYTGDQAVELQPLPARLRDAVERQRHLRGGTVG